MKFKREITVSLVALLTFSFNAALQAQTPSAVQPVKRHPSATTSPFRSAQIQIERLRQTASKLRLLSDQPTPSNLAPSARDDFVEHREWLRQAESRITALANEWENQLKPLKERNTVGAALNLNAFFESQSQTLQTKLRRESLAQASTSEHLRSFGATARLVISKMY